MADRSRHGDGRKRRPPRHQQGEADALGVKIEAEYTVGEYDIVILSAKESRRPANLAAAKRLQDSARRRPRARAVHPQRHEVLRRQGQPDGASSARALTYLRPIQFAFESPKFMLPIRLGMINAQGPQDLVIYMLTENGRVETTNYRTVKLPTGMDVPEYVRDEFSDFYKAMFDEQVKRNDMRAVFTEYVWNMGWCDPCAGPPLSHDELRSLGVFWLDDQPGGACRCIGVRRPHAISHRGGAMPVMLTRLHVRYSADTFPEDLIFQETQDQENFQARYVLHRPWEGSPSACEAARNYFDELNKRRAHEAETLADLTGWNLEDVIKKAGLTPGTEPKAWWQGLGDREGGRSARERARGVVGPRARVSQFVSQRESRSPTGYICSHACPSSRIPEVDRDNWDDLARLFDARGGPKSCYCMVWRATPAELNVPMAKAAKLPCACGLLAACPSEFLATTMMCRWHGASLLGARPIGVLAVPLTSPRNPTWSGLLPASSSNASTGVKR